MQSQQWISRKYNKQNLGLNNMLNNFNKNFKFLAVITMMLLSAGAFSEESYYGGSFSSVDIRGLGDGPTINATVGRFGSKITENISGEFRLGTGHGANSGNIELGYLIGAYLKVGSTTNSVNPYAILGFTKGKITAGNDSYSKGDASWGLGIDFGAVEAGTFTVEYINYMDKSHGFEVNGLSVGFTTIF